MDVNTSLQVAQSATSIGSSLWPIVFLAVMVFFVVYSAVLIFHWFSFSMHTRTAIVATISYLVISAVFVFAMLASVVTLTTL